MSNIGFSDRLALLAIDEKEGMTIEEIALAKNMEVDDVTTIVNKLERWGMIRGNWEKRDGVWVREYWVSGEGTQAYIEALKVLQSSASTTREEM